MECYYELGKPSEGLKYQKLALEALKEQCGSIDAYLNNYYCRKSRLYTMGALYYYVGDLAKAKEYFGQIEAEPKCRHCSYMECEDYWEAMGFLLEEESKLPEAIQCYQKACRESVDNDLSICKVEKLTKMLRKRR